MHERQYIAGNKNITTNQFVQFTHSSCTVHAQPHHQIHQRRRHRVRWSHDGSDATMMVTKANNPRRQNSLPWYTILQYPPGAVQQTISAPTSLLGYVIPTKVQTYKIHTYGPARSHSSSLKSRSLDGDQLAYIKLRTRP